MQEFGHVALTVGWFLALYAVIMGTVGALNKSERIFFSVRNASIGTAGALILSLLSLGSTFLQDDYTNQFVWQFSNKEMPWIYKVSAIWGGMDGSMLLWAGILSISVAIMAYRALYQPRALTLWALVVANSSTLFFSTVVLWVTNPFRYIKAGFIPPDGNGLNPLLQNPYMAIHPPMLYLGFTTFAIPCAYCLGALLSGNFSTQWIRLTRVWTLVAWAFLTIGIVLGGHWAYLELGWGGFWAWDPVENASFLPWLTGTAFLHSVIVQERKGMLKMWNVWLVVLTYGLTVFGTFLTRSGVVQSIHAFASTDIGWVFLLYLGILIGGTALITWWRRKELQADRVIESVFSRETAFLLNNLVLLSICFAVLWGVLFPVLVEAVTGEKQTIGIPFYNAINVPLFLLLLALMGVGPLVAWRRATLDGLRKAFLTPFLFALGGGVLLVCTGITSFYAVLSYSLCLFVFTAILVEIYRAVKARRSSEEGFLEGTASLMKKHRVRYGGYLVHIGVVVAALGITASMAHKVEKEFLLGPGERFEVGKFAFELKELFASDTANYEGMAAKVLLKERKSGNFITELHPELRHYRRNDENTSEVALRMGPLEDVYLVLAGLDPENESRAALKLFINPLQVWLWIGVGIMILGTIVVLIPQRKREGVPA